MSLPGSQTRFGVLLYRAPTMPPRPATGRTSSCPASCRFHVIADVRRGNADGDAVRCGAGEHVVDPGPERAVQPRRRRSVLPPARGVTPSQVFPLDAW